MADLFEPSVGNCPADNPDVDRTHRGRFQFSIRSLLLFTLFIALILTSVLMYRRLSRAERELDKLRSIAGYLKVEDESQVHAIALDTYDQWTWKWRVYLPKGRRFVWKIMADKIPVTGAPNSESHGYSSIDQATESNEVGQEFIVSLAVRKGIDGRWVMPLSVGGTTLRASISDDCLSKLREGGVITEWVNAGTTTVADSKRGRIVLLKRYANPSTTSSSRNPEKVPGIMLWLEEVPSKGR